MIWVGLSCWKPCLMLFVEVEMADTAVPTNLDPKTELQLQFQMMRMQLEQRDREHAREMQLQREWFDGQSKMQIYSTTHVISP